MLNLQLRIKGFAIDLEESETLGTTFLNLNRSSEFAYRPVLSHSIKRKSETNSKVLF